MSPQDKQAVYWTVGIVAGLAAILAVAGYFFGMFGTGAPPGA